MAFQPLFNYPNNKLYQYEAYPVKLYCNFVVDSTNGNGLGIRSLKGAGIANVFMHTSATPGKGLGGHLNPNPPAGFVLIQMKNNFNVALSGSNSMVSPVVSPSQTSTTANSVYIITSLGTATLAQWLAAGTPVGFTPSVGMTFVAAASGTIGGSATVGSPGVSGITSIETVGDPNQTINNSNIAVNAGAILMLQCLADTSSSVTTKIPTAPANGTVIALRLRWDGSNVSIPDGGPSNTGTGGL